MRIKNLFSLSLHIVVTRHILSSVHQCNNTFFCWFYFCINIINCLFFFVYLKWKNKCYRRWDSLEPTSSWLLFFMFFTNVTECFCRNTKMLLKCIKRSIDFLLISLLTEVYFTLFCLFHYIELKCPVGDVNIFSFLNRFVKVQNNFEN